MYTFGADPEVFIGTLNGVPVSAIGLIGGTKDEPKGTKHGFVQEDNVAAEFNIPPSSTPEEFSSNIELVLGDLHEITQASGYHILSTASEEFPDNQLMHPLALVAGCDPDFDAYTLLENDPPDIVDSNLRTAGAHVHIGMRVRNKEEAAQFIKALDLFLAVPAVFVEDERRKKLYGKAGAFRMKDYGVEYRTLSNFWVFVPEYREWVVRQCLRALDEWKTLEFPEARVQQAVNTNNKQLASILMRQFNLTVVGEK